MPAVQWMGGFLFSQWFGVWVCHIWSRAWFHSFWFGIFAASSWRMYINGSLCRGMKKLPSCLLNIFLLCLPFSFWGLFVFCCLSPLFFSTIYFFLFGGNVFMSMPVVDTGECLGAWGTNSRSKNIRTDSQFCVGILNIGYDASFNSGVSSPCAWMVIELLPGTYSNGTIVN